MDGLALRHQNLGEKDKIESWEKYQEMRWWLFGFYNISLRLLLQSLILEAVFASGTFKLPVTTGKHGPGFFIWDFPQAYLVKHKYQENSLP